MADQPSPKRAKTVDVVTAPSSPTWLNAPKTTPRRASYLSPTKASLARYNPSLLPRPRSARSGISGSPTRRRSYGAAVLGGPGTPRRRRSLFGEDVVDQSNILGDYDLGSGENTVELRRGDLPQGLVGLGAEDEGDELPPTPDDAEGYSPPRGILYSSPSKRLGKRLAATLDNSKGKEREVLGERNVMPNARVERPLDKGKSYVEELRAPQVQERKRPRKDENPRPANVPGNSQTRECPLKGAEKAEPELEPDPETKAKLKRKAELQKQIRELEDQIEGYERQVESTCNQPWDEEAEDADVDDLITLLANDPAAAPRKPEKKDSAFSDALMSFLPFSSLLPQQPLQSEDDDDDDEKPIPSHAPVELADQLPYLRLFTPLRMRSSLSLVPNLSSDATQVDLHQLIIRLSAPSHLLSATLKLTLAPPHSDVAKVSESSGSTNPTLSSLEVPYLSPWASSSLGAYLATCAQTRDLSAATWALGSFYRLARRRADCWASITNLYPALVEGAPTRLNSSGRTSLRTKKRKFGTNNAGEDNQHEQRPTAEILRRWIGKDVLVLRNRSDRFESAGSDQDGIVLRVHWDIGFDWTGEAESKVWCTVHVPQGWKKVDSRGSLNKVGRTFDGIVREKGVKGAVSVMVGLFLSEE